MKILEIRFSLLSLSCHSITTKTKVLIKMLKITVRFLKMPNMSAQLRVQSGRQFPGKNCQIEHVALGKCRVQDYEYENWKYYWRYF